MKTIKRALLPISLAVPTLMTITSLASWVTQVTNTGTGYGYTASAYANADGTGHTEAHYNGSYGAQNVTVQNWGSLKGGGSTGESQSRFCSATVIANAYSDWTTNYSLGSSQVHGADGRFSYAAVLQ